jgi:hypothetical protein
MGRLDGNHLSGQLPAPFMSCAMRSGLLTTAPSPASPLAVRDTIGGAAGWARRRLAHQKALGLTLEALKEDGKPGRHPWAQNSA